MLICLETDILLLLKINKQCVISSISMKWDFHRVWHSQTQFPLITWITAFQWGCLGLGLNCLKCCTQKQRSGRVFIRKLSLFTNFWYWEKSDNKAPWSISNLTLRSKGVMTGVKSRYWNYFNNSLINFCSDITMPYYALQSTLIPRNNVICQGLWFWRQNQDMLLFQ